MTTEEIRQKAIEFSKTTIGEMCCRPCAECEYGKYFLSSDTSCLVLCGYEHGFADGVRDFAEWVLRSPKIWQEDYMLLADVETLIHDYEEADGGR